MSDAVQGWQVSERTLRRRLRDGIPGSDRAVDGSWLLPRGWLDEQFDSSTGDITIDLRDPTVADGLAKLLSEFTDLSEKSTAAETRAAVAEHERERLIAQLATVSRDHEQEFAERQRMEQANAEAQRTIAVQSVRIEHLDADLARERAVNQARSSVDARRIEQLDAENRRLEQTVATLHAVAGRRARKRLRGLADQAARS